MIILNYVCNSYSYMVILNHILFVLRCMCKLEVVVSHRALNWRVFSVVSALKVGSRSRALQTYEAWRSA